MKMPKGKGKISKNSKSARKSAKGTTTPPTPSPVKKARRSAGESIAPQRCSKPSTARKTRRSVTISPAPKPSGRKASPCPPPASRYHDF